MSDDENLFIRIELKLDDSSDSLVPCIRLSGGASNVVVCGDEVAWTPSSEERHFLKKSLELFADSRPEKKCVVPRVKSVTALREHYPLVSSKKSSSSRRVELVETNGSSDCLDSVEMDLCPEVQTKDSDERLVSDVDPYSGVLRHHLYDAENRCSSEVKKKPVDQKSVVERVLEKQKKRKK